MSTHACVACGIAQFLKSPLVRYSRSITRQPSDRAISSEPSFDPLSATMISAAISRTEAMHAAKWARSFLHGIMTESNSDIDDQS